MHSIVLSIALFVCFFVLPAMLTSLGAILTYLVTILVSIIPSSSTIAFLLFLIALGWNRSFLIRFISSFQPKRIQWSATLWDYPVDQRNPRSGRIVVCPVYVTIGGISSHIWMRIHPTEGFKYFNAPVPEVRHWYSRNGRRSQALGPRPQLDYGIVPLLPAMPDANARLCHQRGAAKRMEPKPFDITSLRGHFSPPQTYYNGKYQPQKTAAALSVHHLQQWEATSSISRYIEPKRRIHVPVKPTLRPQAHTESFIPACTVAPIISSAQPTLYQQEYSFDASSPQPDVTNIGINENSSFLHVTDQHPTTSPEGPKPFYAHYWNELRARLHFGERLTQSRLDWLNFPTAVLPLPTVELKLHHNAIPCLQSPVLSGPLLDPTTHVSNASSSSSPASSLFSRGLQSGSSATSNETSPVLAPDCESYAMPGHFASDFGPSEVAVVEPPHLLQTQFPCLASMPSLVIYDQDMMLQSPSVTPAASSMPISPIVSHSFLMDIEDIEPIDVEMEAPLSQPTKSHTSVFISKLKGSHQCGNINDISLQRIGGHSGQRFGRTGVTIQQGSKYFATVQQQTAQAPQR